MRVIELGSGVGLGGIAMALLGCQDVTLTDKKDLLPLIQNNIDANLSKSALIGNSPLDPKHPSDCASLKGHQSKGR